MTVLKILVWPAIFEIDREKGGVVTKEIKVFLFLPWGAFPGGLQIPGER